jgi:thioredoxin 1
MLEKPLRKNHSLLAICLCAQWCGTCREYQVTFQQVAAQCPQWQCVWIDVEVQHLLVDGLEVENFPTLLLAQKGRPVFWGPLTPQPQTLKRLLQAFSAERADYFLPADTVQFVSLIELIKKLTTPHDC